MSEKKLSREQFADGLRVFNERIERAQAAGDGRLANEIYQNQQKWITAVNGNAPIVGARDSTSLHGSRGA